MKKLAVLALTAVSFGSFAFSLPSSDAHMSKLDVGVDNASSALKAIHDGGIKCDKITKMTPILNPKGFDVQCDDSKEDYTVLDTDNGMVVKTK